MNTIEDTRYVVFAEGKKKDWVQYDGTDKDAAIATYSKAVDSGKWNGVYIEVNGSVKRFTPSTLS